MRNLAFIFLCLILPFNVFAFDDSENAVDRNFYQMGLGAGNFNLGGSWASAPIITIGKRFELEDCAIELSTSWGEHDFNNGSKLKYYAFPRLMFLKFHDNEASSSFFYGGGLSWSGLRKNEEKFDGIFVEGRLGYEFKRNARLSPNVHLDVIQPLVAHQHTGSHPGPSVLLGMSVGF